MNPFNRWLSNAVIAPDLLDPGDAEIVVLGELNHFVHEKSDFRIAMARTLTRQGYGAFGEELGWSDGARIQQYLRTRDPSILDRLALFGFRGDARPDRDDRPRGVFKPLLDTYPVSEIRAEQTRFYESLSVRNYFGFDVAAGHDGAYSDMAALTAMAPGPVIGESLVEEVRRLAKLRDELGPRSDLALVAALEARIDGLIYSDLVRDAETYSATAPAMGFREEAMKRRIRDARALFDSPFVLMGHAMHLAKDDRLIDAPGIVGPGGGHVSSLGHHICQELGLKVFSVWMVYGEGTDSQPLEGLPNVARFGADTLNRMLAQVFREPTLILTRDAPAEQVKVGHMYNSVFTTSLRDQVDAIYFYPEVSPLHA